MTPATITQLRVRSIVSRTTRALVALALIATTTFSVAQIAAPSADALSSFDNALLDFINDHRQSKGLNRLNEHAPLSNAAADWSTQMRNDSGSPCSANGFRHDSARNIGSRGLPPDTYTWAENIAYACGPPGVPFGVSWSYSNMPAHCQGSLDYTSALMQFCQWVDSAGHRQAIENPDFTHIGVGTATSTGSSALARFSTTRFAASSSATVPAPPQPTTPPAAPRGECAGLTATVELSRGERPTQGNDVIVGTDRADVIDGLGGHDVICAGKGNDRIVGGAGNDTIYAQGGDDIVDAGAGDDRVWGQGGDDDVSGGGGEDFLRGGAGKDKLDAGAGNDRLVGNGDRDELRGGPDRDILRGNGGPDRLLGQDGNDLIIGGGGEDLHHGGSGRDRCREGASQSLNETYVSCEA